MTNTRIQRLRQWQVEAAAYRGPDIAGARRGMDDAVHAECLELAAMIARGETTAEELMREAREYERG